MRIKVCITKNSFISECIETPVILLTTELAEIQYSSQVGQQLDIENLRVYSLKNVYLKKLPQGTICKIGYRL